MATSDATVRTEADPILRTVGPRALRLALAKGIEDFRANPSHLVLLALIYPIIGLIAARLAAGYEVLPLLFPLTAGFALVGPIAALGFSEISRRRERGEAVSWFQAFAVARSQSIGAIATMSLILVVIFILWLIVADGIYNATLGPAPPSGLFAFAVAIFTTPAGWQMLIFGTLVGFLFALAVLTISVASFPLLLERPVSALTAIRTSARATVTNPVTVALWGLIVAAALLIGALPFFVGLAVVIPVLGHASWHLYRTLVEPPDGVR